VGRWDAFLSYSRKNEARAAQIVEAISAAGLTVWFDRNDIRATEELFTSNISEGVVEASCFCVLISAEAADSAWVNKEVEGYARSALLRGGAVMYFLLDGDSPAGAVRWFEALVAHTDVGLDAKVDVRTRVIADDGLQGFVRELVRTFRPERSQPVLLEGAARIRRAEEYWDANNVMARLGWKMPDMRGLLARFDAFLPPYPFEYPPDDQITFVLEQIFHQPDDGAIMANPGSQKAITRIMGYHDILVSAAHRGSPVMILYSMGVDAPILEELQSSYYDVRAISRAPATRPPRPYRHPRFWLSDCSLVRPTDS
jgi:hypothetical protein